MLLRPSYPRIMQRIPGATFFPLPRHVLRRTFPTHLTHLTFLTYLTPIVGPVPLRSVRSFAAERVRLLPVVHFGIAEYVYRR
jgi:hypothetical protein